MPEGRTIKILVVSEESDVPPPVQHRENIIVLETVMAHMNANFSARNPRGTKQGSLVVREVLVQKVQAGVSAARLERRGRASPPRLSSQDCRESLTASPTAAREIRPAQRVPQIKSQD